MMPQERLRAIQERRRSSASSKFRNKARYLRKTKHVKRDSYGE